MHFVSCLSDAFIHYPAEVHPPVRESLCLCACAPPSTTGFGKLAFYARIQGVDAEGGGGGMLIAHSCAQGRGSRWASEVHDKG